MIDWAQLAQRDEECLQEAQIIYRKDGEILLMKYGRELCYKVFNELRFSQVAGVILGSRTTMLRSR